jgi:DNA-directed RNA polymerase specialized sigma subunit
MTLKTKRTRRKNYYFTKVHEDAIIEYVATEDRTLRSELYIEYIQPALGEMVDKITYTYKFTSLPNIDSLRDECKIWLTTVLDKFDPNKGSKAFSYFSVITKNWFIHKVKKNSQKVRREIQYEEIAKELEQKHLSIENDYYQQRIQREFWEHLWVEMNSWDKITLKPNEKRVLEAVKILLSNPDSIEIFNKKAIYLYIREITGLNTKQVVNNLNKLREKYRNFKRKWTEEIR